MAPFSAGECVRVTVDGADGKVSRRALVLTIDDDDTLECEFRGETEEVRVQASTCTPLLPFELAEGPVDAETRKAQGNELFKLRDASAALEQYVLGLKSMQSDAPLSVGCRCLVKASSSPHQSQGGSRAGRSLLLRSAMVLAVDESDGRVDVSYEPDASTNPSRGMGTSGSVLLVLSGPSRRAALAGSASAGGGHRRSERGRGVESGDSAMQASSSAAQASSSFGDWMPWRWAAAAAALPTTTPRADHEQEEEQEEEEEEDGVAPDRILLVVHSTQPALQCALLLNSAKCSLMAATGRRPSHGHCAPSDAGRTT